jgi:MYXO-CTERM domain-containing protein
MKKTTTRITLLALLVLTFAFAANADVDVFVQETAGGTNTGSTTITESFTDTVSIPVGEYTGLSEYFYMYISQGPYAAGPRSGSLMGATIIGTPILGSMGDVTCATTSFCTDSETIGPLLVSISGPGTLEIKGTYTVPKKSSYVFIMTSTLIPAPEASAIELGGVMLLGLGAALFARRRNSKLV